jgi:hypothetical protein
MIAIRHPSTSDAVADFFAIVGESPNVQAWLEPYISRLQREKIWSPAELAEIRRAITKWLDDASD